MFKILTFVVYVLSGQAVIKRSIPQKKKKYKYSIS